MLLNASVVDVKQETKLHLIKKIFSLIFVFDIGYFELHHVMKKNQQSREPLSFEIKKSKDELRKEIAKSLTPEERLQRLTQMIYFAKKHSKVYSKAFQKRLKQGNNFILK